MDSTFSRSRSSDRSCTRARTGMARGDSEFADFVRAVSPRLLHAAYLLTGDRHQAEDDVQTALVRTYTSWPRIRKQDPFAYARKVLSNHVIDRWRRPYR